MKKLLLILLFNVCFSIPGFAQSIAKTGTDNFLTSVKSMDKCWECKLVEGVYTYTFNFVFKMYNILSPIVYTVVLVFLAFWFLWFVWDRVIKSHINFKGGSVFDFLKEIWVKLFTILFVLTLLSRIPANEMFSYTIDPIMSFGAGFGKWILVETRNDNEIMQNYSNAITKKKLPKYDCSDIKLSSNTMNMFKVNSVDTDDDMNVDTLKNLICITGEYANSYTIGLNLGAKILTRGLIGVAETFVTEKIQENLNSLASFIPAAGPLGWIYYLVKFLLIIAKSLIIIGMGINLFIACIGLFIIIQFLYVGLTFITMILDIVIQLAFVGVMMPIVIGAWAFYGKDMLNLRGKLSGRLFWGVLRCSFRLAFLAVSMSISIFLLNELMTTSFDIDSGKTMISLYDSLDKNTSKDILLLLISNVGLLIAMIFTTLVSWMLLTQSIQKADSFSNSLYSGVANNNILEGLTKLTLSSIKYVTQHVKRDVDFYKTRKAAKDYIKEGADKNNAEARKSQIQKWENEIFNEGDDTHIFDVPAEDVVNEFERFRNSEQNDINDNNTVNNDNKNIIMGPEERDNPNRLPAPNVRENIEEVKNLQSSETEFISEQLSSPEYKNLPQEKKQELAKAVISDNKDELKNLSEDAEISEMFTSINATPKEDDEIISDKFITDNLIATEAVSKEDLSNPVIKLQAVYLREQIEKEIKSLPKNEQEEIRKFMKLSKKPNLSKPENKKEYEAQKQIYDKLKDKVIKDFRDKYEKIKNLIEERKNIQKNNKKKTVLTTKNVILVIKKDELNDINLELETLDFFDVAKRSYFRRKIKKLEKEIDDITEKNSLELEDEYDDIVFNWKKMKRKNKSKINPLKRK